MNYEQSLNCVIKICGNPGQPVSDTNNPGYNSNLVDGLQSRSPESLENLGNRPCKSRF